VWVGLLGVLFAVGAIIAIFALRDDNGGSTTTVTTTVTSGSTVTTETTATVTTQPPVVEVPDLTGETQLSSVTNLQDAKLVPNTFPVRSTQQRGTVVAQNPQGGQIAEGSPVRLNISIGNGDVPEATVPDVTGVQQDDARLTLAQAKLCMRTLSRSAPSATQAGDVISQSPAAGASVSQFVQVTIYVAE
jgi:eukaryotic-like serine/threonine-protein kinase